jgi:hypothetical protein
LRSSSLLYDLRFALRRFIRDRGAIMAGIAILALGFGIDFPRLIGSHPLR